MKRFEWLFVGSVVATLMVFATTAEALRMESRFVVSDSGSIRLRSNDAVYASQDFGFGLSQPVQLEQGDYVVNRTISRFRDRDSIRSNTSFAGALSPEPMIAISYENTDGTNFDNGGVIPEPSAALVFGLGALLAGTMARRRVS